MPAPIPISFPYLVYGYVYHSNLEYAIGTTINITGYSTTTGDVDSNGQYIINLENQEISGTTLTVTANHDGETYSHSFKLNISKPGENLNITLKEAINPNNIYVNTHKHYGNECYIFTPYDKEIWCKTSDY